MSTFSVEGYWDLTWRVIAKKRPKKRNNRSGPQEPHRPGPKDIMSAEGEPTGVGSEEVVRQLSEIQAEQEQILSWSKLERCVGDGDKARDIMGNYEDPPLGIDGASESSPSGESSPRGAATGFGRNPGRAVRATPGRPSTCTWTTTSLPFRATLRPPLISSSSAPSRAASYLKAQNSPRADEPRGWKGSAWGDVMIEDLNKLDIAARERRWSCFCLELLLLTLTS